MVDSSFSKLKTQPVLTNEMADTKKKLLPLRIGPYRVKSLFNKGGMSLLYLASSPKNNKTIVIKVLPPKYANNSEISKCFLKEAKIISLSNHPNIIRLYDQGKWEGGLYIAMEFIQGVSLKQFILKKAFSGKKALEIILQVAYALCHLHTHKIIHRDLKPENILIAENGEIKVIDFGIARLKHELKQNNLSESKIIGTPAYMSPEQKENPSTVSFQTDIYALGKITYELLTGQMAKENLDYSYLPLEIKEIIEKTQAVDLDKRYQNIVEFITDISKYLTKIKRRPNIDNENYEEIKNSLHNFSDILLPENMPNFPKLEINIEKKPSIFLSGIYLDIIKISQNQTLVFFAENIKPGIFSYYQLSMLRGFVRASIAYQNDHIEKSSSLSQFLSSINSIIVKDRINSPFAFTALLLDHKNSELIFSSAGHGKLFLASGTSKINALYTPNQFLGSSESLQFSETKSLWNVKDNIFFTSIETSSIIKNKNHTPLKNAISVNMIFPAKVMTKKVLAELEIANLKRAALIININRKS